MARGHQAAVVDGRYLHFSVSQIRDFLRCPRLWSNQKIFGLRTKQKLAQARGTSLHKQPENWYRDGLEPTHEAFLAALPGLPARHVDLLPEHDLVEPTLYVEGVRLEAHSDLIVPPHLGKRYGVPIVIDWKFVSSFKYTEDPANDLQLLTYGYWVSKRWPEVKEVAVELWYFMAEGSADFKPMRKVVPVERCETVWHDEVIPAVLAMRDLVTSVPPTWDAVPENFADDRAACRKYGSCSFANAAYCGALPSRQQSDKLLTAALSPEAIEMLRIFDSSAAKEDADVALENAADRLRGPRTKQGAK